MKYLYLLRHAEREHGFSMEVPLTDRGIQQAKDLGTWLKNINLDFDLILCSPSLRTKQTLEYLQETSEISAKVHFEDSLYNAPPEVVLALVEKLDNEHESVLVIGHNPGIPGLIQYLADDYDLTHNQNWIMNGYPPCTLSKITIDTKNWAEIPPELNTVQRVMPRND